MLKTNQYSVPKMKFQQDFHYVVSIANKLISCMCVAFSPGILLTQPRIFVIYLYSKAITKDPPYPLPPSFLPTGVGTETRGSQGSAGLPRSLIGKREIMDPHNLCLARDRVQVAGGKGAEERGYVGGKSD